MDIYLYKVVRKTRKMTFYTFIIKRVTQIYLLTAVERSNLKYNFKVKKMSKQIFKVFLQPAAIFSDIETNYKESQGFWVQVKKTAAENNKLLHSGFIFSNFSKGD